MSIHIYESEELRKIWLGYVTLPGWIVFIPADGGKPAIFQEVE